jgi:hypothetical protein
VEDGLEKIPVCQKTGGRFYDGGGEVNTCISQQGDSGVNVTCCGALRHRSAIPFLPRTLERFAEIFLVERLSGVAGGAKIFDQIGKSTVVMLGEGSEILGVGLYLCLGDGLSEQALGGGILRLD